MNTLQRMIGEYDVSAALPMDVKLNISCRGFTKYSEGKPYDRYTHVKPTQDCLEYNP